MGNAQPKGLTHLAKLVQGQPSAFTEVHTQASRILTMDIEKTITNPKDVKGATLGGRKTGYLQVFDAS